MPEERQIKSAYQGFVERNGIGDRELQNYRITELKLIFSRFFDILKNKLKLRIKMPQFR